eukprot:2055913-Pleurochrysis_carterae.AAC.3
MRPGSLWWPQSTFSGLLRVRSACAYGRGRAARLLACTAAAAPRASPRARLQRTRPRPRAWTARATRLSQASPSSSTSPRASRRAAAIPNSGGSAAPRERET